jgi:hypothetical protein
MSVILTASGYSYFPAEVISELVSKYFQEIQGDLRTYGFFLTAHLARD